MSEYVARELIMEERIPYQCRPSFKLPADVATYCQANKYHLELQEVFRVLLLDAKIALIKDCLVTIGLADRTLIHPREIFKQAIIQNASSLIMVHNHPSGCTTPSQEDLNLTKEMIAAGKLLHIEIRDHVIVGGDLFYSMRSKEITMEWTT